MVLSNAEHLRDVDLHVAFVCTMWLSNGLWVCKTASRSAVAGLEAVSPMSLHRHWPFDPLIQHPKRLLATVARGRSGRWIFPETYTSFLNINFLAQSRDYSDKIYPNSQRPKPGNKGLGALQSLYNSSRNKSSSDCKINSISKLVTSNILKGLKKQPKLHSSDNNKNKKKRKQSNDIRNKMQNNHNLDKKKKRNNEASKIVSRCYVQILSTPTSDIPGTSVILHFDSYRFIINCSEGIQRKIVEDGVKIGKTPTMLLSRTNWASSAGGLPGLLLSAMDEECESLSVYGPPDTTHLIASCRAFIARNAPYLVVKDMEDPVYTALEKEYESKKQNKYLYPENYIHNITESHSSGPIMNLSKLHFVNIETLHLYPKLERIPDEVEIKLKEALIDTRDAEESLRMIIQIGKDIKLENTNLILKWRNHKENLNINKYENKELNPKSTITLPSGEFATSKDSNRSAKEILRELREHGRAKLQLRKTPRKRTPVFYSNFAVDQLDVPGKVVKSELTIKDDADSERAYLPSGEEKPEVPKLPIPEVKVLDSGLIVKRMFRCYNNDGSNYKNDIVDNSRLWRKTDLMEAEQGQPKAIQSVLAYRFVVPEKRAPFLVEKAIQLGIPRGDMYKCLKDGQSVTLDDGRVIHPHQVLGRNTPGGEILFFDCPSIEYLKGLLSNEFLVNVLEKLLKPREIIEEERRKLNQTDDRIPIVIIYSLGEFISMDPRFRALIKKIDSIRGINGGYSVEQIVCSPEISSMNDTVALREKKYIEPYYYGARLSKALNILDPVVFKVASAEKSLIQFKENYLTKLNQASTFGGNGTVYRMAPSPSFISTALGIESGYNESLNDKSVDHESLSKKFIDTSKPLIKLTKNETLYRAINHSLDLNIVNYSNEVIRRTDAIIKEHASKGNLDNPKNFANCIHVSPIGTGSSAPSRQKNMSGILLNIGGISTNWSPAYALLDASENIVGTLKRKHGLEKSKEILSNLRLIFISHLHADHHLGIWTVLKEWLKVRRYLHDENIYSKSFEDLPLVIIGPAQIKTMLLEAASRENINLPLHFAMRMIIFIESSTLCGTSTPYNDAIGSDFDRMFDKCTKLEGMDRSTIYSNKALENYLGTVTTFPVAHCYQSFGIILGNESQIIYTGDCRPKNNLSSYLSTSTRPLMIIHEATLDDLREEDANSKMHSTVGSAISVARSIQAKYCLLTHFSQRYKWFPTLTESNYSNISRIIMSGPETCGGGFDITGIPVSNIDGIKKPETIKNALGFLQGEFNIRGYLKTLKDNDLLVHPLNEQNKSEGNGISKFLKWRPYIKTLPPKILNDKDLTLSIGGISEADIYNNGATLNGLTHNLSDVNNFRDMKVRKAVISMNLPSSFSNDSSTKNKNKNNANNKVQDKQSSQQLAIQSFHKKLNEQHMTLAFANDHLFCKVSDLWRVQVISGIFSESFARDTKPSEQKKPTD